MCKHMTGISEEFCNICVKIKKEEEAFFKRQGLKEQVKEELSREDEKVKEIVESNAFTPERYKDYDDGLSWLEKKASKAKLAILRNQYDKANDLENHFKDWNRSEINAVYEGFAACPRGLNLIAAYTLAINLKRTLFAIRWMKMHLFSHRTDLHRGEEVTKFRKEKGLDLGDDDGCAGILAEV